MSLFKKFSEREKFEYRAKKSKPGSTYKTKDGEVKVYTDFQRGVMVGRNKEAKRSLAIANLKAGKRWNPDTKRYE